MLEGEAKPRGLVVISLFAVVVGAVGGLGAWFFRLLIGLFHNLLFLGTLSTVYDANSHTPAGPWGAGVILVPVLGALVVAFMVKNFAPETKGHGVPEVMDAIHYGHGIIRPVVALVKALASGLTIGSGGSVGREGPIVQIGAAFGSMLGQWTRLPARQRITLIAAGAGAGIGATFNAPLGGLVFSLELMLVSVNAANILPVALATVTGTYIGRELLGITPAFDIPGLHAPTDTLLPPLEMLLMAPFGVMMGLFSVLFIRGVYWAEDRFDAIPGNYYTRHMLGMASLGVVIFLFLRLSGQYYVEGVSYATIVDILNGALGNPLFLLLLFSAKFLLTGLTLGSGGSGGIFSPALFMGAALGAAFGHAARSLFPGMHVDPNLFAVAGMAAAVGGATGAVLTSIVITFEMTRDLHAILPIVICAATAYAVRKSLSRESIYTLKPFRRGHVVPEGLKSARDASLRVSDVMRRDFTILPEGEHGRLNPNVSIVVDKGEIVGAVPPILAGVSDSERAEAAAPHRFIIVPEHAGLVETLRDMRGAGAKMALVSVRPDWRRADDVVGVVSAEEIIETLVNLAELE